MENKDLFEMVTEFHQVFKQPIAISPCIPPDERIAFRHNFIKEELLEMITASLNKDVVEMADGLCDVMYVLVGYILEVGVQDRFLDLMNEVHRSNISKTCSSEREARLTIEMVEPENGSCYYKRIGDKYVVYRTSDSKVMKSISYSKPDLKKFFPELSTKK